MTRCDRSPGANRVSFTAWRYVGTLSNAFEYMNESYLPALSIMSLSPHEKLPVGKGGAHHHRCCFGVLLEDSVFWKCQQGTGFKAMMGKGHFLAVALHAHGGACWAWGSKSAFPTLILPGSMQEHCGQ